MVATAASFPCFKNVSNIRSKELEDKTPVRPRVLSPQETITVTDPCHPLFGHECELVEIYYRQDGTGFCRVKLGQLGRTDVPLTATNRAIPMVVPDSLLSYQSVQQLLLTYQGIMEARDDAVSVQAKQGQENATDRAQNSLAVADGQTAGAVPAHNREDLSAAGQSDGQTTGGA
jgi:hypothetical protein